MPSDPVLVALITSLAPTLTVLLAFGALLRQGEKIHLLVNSNLTSVKADLAIANGRIEALVKEIKVLRERLDGPL